MLLVLEILSRETRLKVLVGAIPHLLKEGIDGAALDDFGEGTFIDRLDVGSVEFRALELHLPGLFVCEDSELTDSIEIEPYEAGPGRDQKARLDAGVFGLDIETGDRLEVEKKTHGPDSVRAMVEDKALLGRQGSPVGESIKLDDLHHTTCSILF